MSDVVRTYTRYAIGLLLLTLLGGVYLRASFAWPQVRSGLSGANVVHAHSHVGFFGWAVLAAFAVMLEGVQPAADRRARGQRSLAHVIAAAALLAFAGFALRGYDTVTIALSATHVLLWIVFAAVSVQAIHRGGTVASRFYVAALCFLVAAGAATVVPVLLMVRGVSDPWLQQLGVKLFLTPFVNGFLLLTALGAAYRHVRAPRHATSVLALICAGTVPSTLLHVAAPVPADWLVGVGRAGMLVLGAGVLLFAADLLRDRLPPLLRVTAWSAAVAGMMEWIAGTGIASGIMHNRSITIAFLHVVLLGVVTPALLHVLRPAVARRRVGVFATGLLVMTGALVALGVPAVTLQLDRIGVPLAALARLAFAGGALAAVALAALCAPVHAAASQARSERKSFREEQQEGAALPTRA